MGIASIASKMLCSTHNTALSPLDQAAGQAKRVLGEMARRREDRVVTLRTLGPRRFKVREYPIDGHLLERWAIKVLAGFFSATGQDEDRWSLTQTNPIEPPPAMVNAAFGLSKLAPPLGLYYAHNIGQYVDYSDGVRLEPLFDGGSTNPKDETHGAQPRTGLAAMLFTFLGQRFAIWLSDEPINRFKPPRTSGLGQLAFAYRPIKVTINQGGVPSQDLTFSW